MPDFDPIALIVFAVLATVLAVSVTLLSRQVFRQRSIQAGRLRQLQVADRVARELEVAQAGDERTQDLAESQRFLRSAAIGTERARVRLREVVRESVERMSPVIAARGFALRIHQGGDPQVNADAGSLGHALDQVLKLALRGQGRAIEAHLIAEGKEAEVSVQADDVGFDDLTLAVVRQILEVQGGEMIMNHTVIRMRLPLAT